MNRWKYVLVGLLVGAFAFPLVWNSDPLVIGQTVTVDSTQSPLVVNAVADLADLTPTDGQSVIIKTGAEKGLWYYDKDSATATSVSVLNGPGSVGRFLVINNAAGSVAAATAITAAEITDDSLLELQAFDGSSAKSLTLEELKKTGVQVANVVQLGADPTGVADSTTAIQAAIDSGAAVYLPPGTYATDEVTFTGDTVIFGPGVISHASDGYTIVIAPTMPAAVSCVISTVASTSGSLMPNTTQLVAVAHGLAVGDVLKLTADATYAYSASAYVGEMARVQRVADADTVILDHQIEDFLTSASTIKYTKVPKHKVDIDVRVERRGSLVGTTDYPVIYCKSAINPRIKLRGSKVWGTGIYATQCWQGEFEIQADDVDQDETVAGRIGYGVVVGGGSRGTRVTGSVSGSRHAVTSLNFANGSYDETKREATGRATDIVVHDMVSTGANLTAFDTHEMSNRWTFSNCRAIGMVPRDAAASTVIGYFDRGLNSRFMNCSAAACRVAFQLSTGDYAHGVNNRVVITSPVVDNATYAAFAISNTPATYTQTVIIGNPSVKSCYQAVWNGTLANVVISGGHVVSTSTMFNTYGSGNISVSGTYLELASAAGPFAVNNSAGTRRIRFVGATLAGTARDIVRLYDAANDFSCDIIDCNITATLAQGVKENDATTRDNVFVTLQHTSSGSPEAVWDADVGSRFYRNDGGASTILYVKESGTDNTGWTATQSAVMPVEASTAGSGAPNVLLSTESAKVLTNEGTTAANYHTLPTAVAGLTYTFVVQDADGLRITAASGDTIRLGPNITATAGYIESTAIGDIVTVTAINTTEWVGHAYGTWTNGTWTYALADTP